MTQSSIPCRVALKEWAVVVDALARGRQTILLRKGGISEKRGAFEVEHREFLLLPTGFHQNPDDLIPEAHAALARIAAEPRDPATIVFTLRAAVEAVFRVEDEARLAALVPFHVLSPAAVAKRFHYKKPGLNVLLLRAHRLPAPVTIPDRKEYEGCVSWVELNQDLVVPSGAPVLDDEKFARTTASVVGACHGMPVRVWHAKPVRRG